MKTAKYIMVIFFAICLAVPCVAMAGKGYMGGDGDVVAADEPPDDTGGMPDTVEGPLNDKMSDAGKLFGDLFKILRQQGVAGDEKLVPAVNAAGEAVLTYDETFGGAVQLFVTAVNDTTTPDAVVGGEPVLTVIDSGDDNDFSDYGWYAAEIGVNPDETPIYGAAQSPYPAQCVQPVASYARWGDIGTKTGLSKNRLPMVITYDYTWGRSECAVGKLDGEVVADPVTGELTIPVNEWFIEPGGTWSDPNNDEVTYPDGVLWTALIGEVHFGRLNLSRAPEAVLQAAFDEAINNLNDPDTIAIEIDAAGRLLLTKNVYDELLVDPDTGLPILIGTVKKAIDSPLENVALYVKLMQDGHLVTPGDERAPIDRSPSGGIPIWKMLELEDGPADAALRPTIDIAKLREWGMSSLVDVIETDYYTYYQCVDANGAVTECLCWDPDPVQPELDGKWVACDSVADRELFVVSTCPDGMECAGPFEGIMTDGAYAPDATDLNFTASFLAAAADKTGDIGVDMVVYLNSILGINQVLGTSADGAVDYEKNPAYFNFKGVSDYGRNPTFKERGQVDTTGGGGVSSTYDGTVRVLVASSYGVWNETDVAIKDKGFITFDNIDLGPDGFPNGEDAKDNILGFTQQSDDDLSVIKFVHTYQIPGLR